MTSALVWSLLGARTTVSDNSADGTMPARAFRYCEAMRLASGAGVTVGAAMDFDLMHDPGTNDIIWRHFVDGVPTDWEPLQPSAWPEEWEARWNAVAPPELAGKAPPMLTALREPMTIQLVLGVAVANEPELGIWVRGPANLAPGGIDWYEGILNGDGGRLLFINGRLRASNQIIAIRTGPPLVQLVPITVESLGVAPVIFDGPTEGLDWGSLMGGVQTQPYDKPPGSYAAAERRAMKNAE